MPRTHPRVNAARRFLSQAVKAVNQETHGSSKLKGIRKPPEASGQNLWQGSPLASVTVSGCSNSDGKIVCPSYLPARATGVGKLVASSSGGRVDRTHAMEWMPHYDANAPVINHQTAVWSPIPTTPAVRPVVSASICGASGCHRKDNLQIVRPGDGYQRVLCRRHATQLLSAGGGR